jgi:hypothetical protein
MLDLPLDGAFAAAAGGRSTSIEAVLSGRIGTAESTPREGLMRSAISALHAAAVLLAALPLAGCSLLTIELPEDPLTKLEINARLATHRFAGHVSKTVSDAADEIAAVGQAESIALNALRWKLAATTAVSTTAFQVSPRDALVDTWIYCVQMADFLAEGAGGSLFGPPQSTATTAAAGLVADVGELGVAFVPVDELPRYQEFVRSYADEVPLRDLATPRESAVPAFYALLGIGEEEAVTTVGTLSQVVSDFGSRVSLLGEQLPNRTAWGSELFLRESGFDGRSLQAELGDFSARVERVAVVAEQASGMVDAALLSLNEELAVLIEAIDTQRAAVMEGLQRERMGLTEAVARERAALIEAVAVERAVTLEELERYSDQVIADAWSQIRGLMGIAIFGLIALLIVLFGVPFGLGMLVGRVTKRPT